MSGDNVEPTRHTQRHAGNEPWPVYATFAQRREEAFRLRSERAEVQRSAFELDHPNNGDEELYADRNYFASFSRGLPHDSLGEVEPAAYRALLAAIRSGTFEAFDSVPLAGKVKLENPLKGWAYHLEGRDPWGFNVPPPPCFASPEFAAELAEAYWFSLTRDIPFARFDTDPTIAKACDELTRLTAFKGPKVAGRVTPRTFACAGLPGELIGPRLSQFSLLDVPMGSFAPLKQVIKGGTAQVDYMTEYDEWLAAQNGIGSRKIRTYSREFRYPLTPRDWFDAFRSVNTLQILLNTASILLSYGDDALDPSNPYRGSRTQAHGTTFGLEDIKGLLGRVWGSVDVLAGFQKWVIHRRPKPEQTGGRLHNHLVGRANYPFDSSILDSAVVAAVYAKQGSYLLSQLQPSGGGQEPCYTQSAATFLGAGVTILKWFFNEAFVIPRPVQSTDDGSALDTCRQDLTVGNELNKLAAGAFAPTFNGSHVRSNTIAGLKLGEEYAISVISDRAALYAEKYAGSPLTKFDGTRLSI